MIRAYEEIIDFIAAGVDARGVANFLPSESARERVAELIRREKTSDLSAEEAGELDYYLQLEHLMRLVKGACARASYS